MGAGLPVAPLRTFFLLFTGRFTPPLATLTLGSSRFSGVSSGPDREQDGTEPLAFYEMTFCNEASSAPLWIPAAPGLMRVYTVETKSPSVTGGGRAPSPVQVWGWLTPQVLSRSNGGSDGADGPGAGEWRPAALLFGLLPTWPRTPDRGERDIPRLFSTPSCATGDPRVTPSPRS